MKHKITIRDLNTYGNQLPKNNPIRKDIHAAVLDAVKAKVSCIYLDNEDEIDIHLLNGIAAAKILEKESNKKTKRIPINPTPYISVQEYLLGRGKRCRQQS